MQKSLHSLFLFLVLIGVPHGIHQNKVAALKVIQRPPHLLRSIDNPKRHLQDIRIGAQLLSGGDPVGIRCKKHYFFPPVNTELRRHLGNRCGLPNPCGTYEKDDLGAALGRLYLSWLAELENHSLVNICKSIVKRHAGLVQLLDFTDNLVRILLIHLIRNHLVIDQLHAGNIRIFFRGSRLRFLLATKGCLPRCLVWQIARHLALQHILKFVKPLLNRRGTSLKSGLGRFLLVQDIRVALLRFLLLLLVGNILIHRCRYLDARLAEQLINPLWKVLFYIHNNRIRAEFFLCK